MAFLWQGGADRFFSESTAPASIGEYGRALQNFVAEHTRNQRTVVCVSSGGTTVPLETNTVRFIDNFSTGSRGAVSAEQFLNLGYAVIYMHRKGCVMPFARSVLGGSSHIDFSFLDRLKIHEDSALELIPEGQSTGGGERAVDALRSYHDTKATNTLLALEFMSVQEYLWILKLVSSHLEPLGRHAMMYLAAAVSDFFVPPNAMPTHKIQSAGGSSGLTLHLAGVPKCLGLLKSQWAPQCYLVSFKLETDSSLLVSKAHQAIEKYSVDMVVANELQSRYTHVMLVTRDGEYMIHRPSESVIPIEYQLAQEVAQRHFDFIGAAQDPVGQISTAASAQFSSSMFIKPSTRLENFKISVKKGVRDAVKYGILPASFFMCIYLQHKLSNMIHEKYDTRQGRLTPTTRR